MSDEHFDLPELFAQAAELAGEPRARFLAELAARSPELAAELTSLLAAAERSTPWLNGPAWRPAGRADVPAEIGPYRVLAEVGRGGAGRVFLAEETGEGFVRRVAVKVLAGPLPTADAVARFRTEGRLLAGLEHPGIARLYDAGTTDDGVLYLAMEFIDGVDVLRFAEERALGPRERVELFLQVLEAVQFAHRQLIVHRDLKPANLLVDATGRVKLLDFGIARLLEDAEAGVDAALTRTGQRWLTPAYASPEQIRGERTTTAADIYSLGVVLYELLTGRRPHLATGPEWESAVLSTEPAPPSRVGPGAAALQGDLDAITLCALRKEPDRRYRSVEAFADDLRRYLEGFPVLARQGTRRYRWSKFVQRNRRSLAAAAAIFVALSAGLGIALWQARRAAAAQAVAERRFADLQGLASAMIFEVTDALAPLDGAAPVMELTLDRALEYLKRLEADGGDDLHAELAEGYERVGRISAGLPVFSRGTGRLEKGLAAFERALALRRRLADRPEAAPADQARLGRSLILYCDGLRAGRNPELAESICREAVDRLDKLVAEHPDRRDWELDLATAMSQQLLVKGAIRGGDSVVGSQEAARAGALWLKIGADAPAEVRSNHHFAWGMSFMSGLLRRSDQPREAMQLAEWAVEATTHPNISTSIWDDGLRPRDRAEALEAAAFAHQELGRREEALKEFQEVYTLRQSMARKDRQQHQQILLFNMAGSIALLCAEMGDVECGERAVANQQALIDEAVGWWKPDTVTWCRGLAAADRGRLYHTLLERSDLSPATRRQYAARAREGFTHAIDLHRSLLQDGKDPFGVSGKITEYHEALAELAPK